MKSSERQSFEEKLKESVVNYKILNNELETILDLIPGILFCKDKNDVVTRVNQNFADLFNSKKEDIIGKTTFDLFPKDQAENFRKDDLEVINTGKPKLNIEEVVDFPDKKIWSTTSKVPYYNDKSEINGIIGLAIDITKRKKAEQKLKVSEKQLRELNDELETKVLSRTEALKSSEQRYKTILDGIVTGVWVADKDDNISYANKGMGKIAGIPSEQLVNTNVLNDFPESTLKYFRPYYLKARNTLKSVFYDSVPVITPAGRQSFQSGWLIPLTKDGKFYNTICTVEDITERKKTKQNLKESEKKLRNLNKELEQKVEERTKKLQESEQRLKSFMNSATDGFIRLDAKLNYIDVNNIALQILGMTREEIIGKNILDIAPNLKETGKYDKLLDVIKTGEPFSTDDVTLKGIDGSLDAPFSVRAFKVGDNLGLIITDITEIKRVELKLREKNIELSVLNKIITLGNESTSLQEFLEKSYDQVLEVVNFDRGGVYLYDPETHHNKLVLHKNIHPDFLAAVEDVDISGEPFNMVFDKNNPFYIEDFSKFMEGSKNLGVYSAVIVPLRSKDEYIGSMNVGSHKYQILSQKDLEQLVAIGKQMGIIIQKFESEKLLKESEQRLKSFMNSATDGFLLFDTKLNYIDVNNVTLQIIGMTREEIIGKNILDIEPNLKETGRYDKFLDVIKTGEPFSTDNAILKGKNGHLDTPFSLRAFKVGGNLGLIITDITEIKRVELKLREVNNLKSEFLRRASHELKTPLISIKGFSELILSLHEDKLEPSIIAKLREIDAGCERLQNIINNILKASRLESPELRPSKHREDLSFLINFCVLELESMTERRKQSIKLDILDQLYVNVEKEEIHDVLSNLLSNAIKYTPPRGKIEIKTELKEDFVVVSVKDNGIGFTDEQKKLIFQEFGKIERYGQGLDLGIDGTGLGLYISKKIVESHGGKIWMESEGKNMGSTFYFSLPKMIE